MLLLLLRKFLKKIPIFGVIASYVISFILIISYLITVRTELLIVCTTASEHDFDTTPWT